MLNYFLEVAQGIIIGFSFVMSLWFTYHMFKYHLKGTNRKK